MWSVKCRCVVLLDIMLVLKIMGSPWIDQLNAIFYSKIFFAEIGCITTVIAGFIAINLSFCNCSFLCKKIVSYITYHKCFSK